MTGLIVAVAFAAGEACVGFSGRVVTVIDPGQVLAVSVGEPIAGSVSYPGGLADSQPESWYGVYLSHVPPAGLSATVGPYHSSAAQEVSISVMDSPAMGDQVMVGSAWVASDLPGYTVELSIRYRDTSGGAIDSDELPNLADPWPVRRLVIQGCISGDACTRPAWEIWADIEDAWPCAGGRFAGERKRGRAS